MAYLKDESNGQYKIEIFARWNSGGDNGTWITTNRVVSVGGMTHIAVCYDARAAGGTPKVYVNGKSAALTQTIGPTAGTWDGPYTDEFLLGCRSGISQTLPIY